MPLRLELGAGARLWSDRDPVLYTVCLTLRGPSGPAHTVLRRFGLRRLEASGRQRLRARQSHPSFVMCSARLALGELLGLFRLTHASA